jgi:hypothetical protein
MDNTIGLMGFLTQYDGGNQQEPVEVITFCPQALERFTTESLRNVRTRAYKNHQMHIGDIKLHRMTFNILHELTHSYELHGPDAYGTLDFIAFREHKQ